MSVTKDQLIDAICNLSLLDAAEIVKTLEEKLGVSAAAPVAMVAAAPGAGGAAAEEKTAFDAELTDAGPASNKIPVIKIVREVTSLGLKEAKDLVEGAPKILKEGITKEEGATLVAKFAEQGAKVTLK